MYSEVETIVLEMRRFRHISRELLMSGNGVNFADREVLISRITSGELTCGLNHGGDNQGLVIVLVYLAHVLMGVRFVGLVGCIIIETIYAISKPEFQNSLNQWVGMGFVFGDQESRVSERPR